MTTKKKVTKTVSEPKYREARFIVIDGEYVCSERDFCASDWDSDTHYQYFCIKTPIAELTKRDQMYREVKLV